jgi:hypothetical protein
MIDAYATERVYLDHLAPILAELGHRDARLLVPTPQLVEHAAAKGLYAHLGKPRDAGPPTLLAGYRDRADCHPARRLALVEHGAGQTYCDANNTNGYAGGEGWHRLELVLVPGPHAAKGWLAEYPDLEVVEVGCPRLDRWADRAWSPPRYVSTHWNRRPVVAFTWHWPCAQTAETWHGFEHWWPAMRRVAQLGSLDVVGHEHPKWGQTRRYAPRHLYEKAGIPFVADADDVFAAADLLVADNTSLLYEFAAVGKPVLVLNAPGYRRDVSHGLRFWDAIPGHMLDPGDDLHAGIEVALRDMDDLRDLRRAAVAAVYANTTKAGTVDRTATARAVETLRRWAAE